MCNVLLLVFGSVNKTDQMKIELPSNNGYEKLNKSTMEYPHLPLPINESIDMDLIIGPTDNNEDISKSSETSGENVVPQKCFYAELDLGLAEVVQRK